MTVENRRFEERDKVSILELFRLMHPDSDAETRRARWEWVHDQNPNIPDGRIPAWVCSENGVVKVNVSVLCARFKLGDTTVDGGWLVNVFRHPGFKGVISLPRISKKLALESGFLAGLGLSDDAVKFARAFRWRQPGAVPRYVKILSVHPLFMRKLRFKMFAATTAPVVDTFLRIVRKSEPGEKGYGDLIVKQIDEFGREADRIWESASPYYSCLVERKRDYLNWRFVHQPGNRNSLYIFFRNSEPVGYSALNLKTEADVKTGVITDVFAAPGDLPHLVSHAESIFRSEKAGKIVCFCSHTALVRAVEKCGFRLRPSRMIFTYSPHRPTFEVPGISILENWYLTAGDSDQDRPPD